jgi:hypothetical protein
MNVSFLNFEAHVAPGPEFFDFVVLNDLSAIGKADGFARKVLRFSRQHFTKSRLLLMLAMSNHRKKPATARLSRGQQSRPSPPSRHQRKPSITPKRQKSGSISGPGK